MSLDDQAISWSEFYEVFTGIRFTIKKDDCQIFVPTYANIIHSTTERSSAGEVMSLPVSGTDMTFQDSWSSKAFLIAGQPERLDKVFIKDLWEYPYTNVQYDEFVGQLSLQDIEVDQTTLYEFVKDLDSFMIFNKLDNVGDVWWVSNIKANIQSNDSQYSNVEVVNTSGNDIVPTEILKFWSPDKYLNDEYKRYVANPISYSGFLLSDDFKTGGWFSIPHLRISTKPFEKLKIAEILLNINYTFDPDKFGIYFSLDSNIGARIKDSTSNEILDSSENKGVGVKKYSNTLLANWTGGLVSTENIQTLGPLGNFVEDSCKLKADEIQYKTSENNENAISHAIDAQITVKPNYTFDTIDFLGTIDPINWISVDTDSTENAHKIGALNVDRAFGGASGDISNGIVVGGINTNDETTMVTSSSEIWQSDSFIKNVLITTNTPRCFHLQGGTGSSSCAILGGFSQINNSDFTQFSRYGKTNVIGNIEFFNVNPDIEISFFSTIADYSMNIPRGESAGNIDITTDVRKDKFEIENLISQYNITPNDEQKILEFVNNESTDIINNVPVPSNYRRYNSSNIDGFIYAGNKTGNVYLVDTPLNEDIIDSFESVKTTFIDVSQNTVGLQTTANTIQEVLDSIDIETINSVVSSVVSIPGTNNTGVNVSLQGCGKYKIVYIDGAYNYNNSTNRIGEVIESVLSINSTTGNGASSNLPYCGTYRIQYLNGTWRAWESDPQVRTELLVYINGISGGEIFTTVDVSGGNNYYHDICVTNENSLLRLAAADSFWGDNFGFVNVSITYIGTENCSSCNVPISAFGSNTQLLLNEQEIDEIFKSGFQITENDVEYYNNSRPTRKEYVFCSHVPNSQIRLYSIDLSDGNYENNGGFVNAQIYYLGESDDCECIISETETTQNITDVTVTYGEVDPSRNYPVRCHGHLYVGNNTGGLSTGGRTEYNDISIVECTLREKYGVLADNSCGNDIFSSNSLESNRVLDLVYEYDGFTWIRRQNLFESVYYHTGVGNATNAIMWGGLHDTLNAFSYNYNINTADVQSIPVSAFDCDDSKTILSSENISYGVEYELLTDLVNSTCWFTPTWETDSVTGNKLDNPKYRPGNATLAYAKDDNFPNILVLTVGPTNPTSLTEQSISAAPYTIPASNKVNISTITYIPEEAVFGAISYVINDDGTVSNKKVSGNFHIQELTSLTLTSLDYDIYTSTAFVGSLHLEFSDIRVITGGNVLLYYDLNHIGSNFVFRGYGILTIESMQHIWQSIKDNTSITALSNVFFVQESSKSPELEQTSINGTATLKFESEENSAVLIGVENVSEEWGSENCALTITDFINFTASQALADVKRWGHPVWVSGLVQDISGLFSIDYSYSKSIGIADNKNGMNIFEIGDIEIQSNNISSFINNRILIKGLTETQTHEFDAMNDNEFIAGSTAVPSSNPLNIETYCESISATASQSISAALTDIGYSEWATSFIQQSRSDERFALPQKFISSNYYDIVGDNTQLSYVPSRWKRFMDGVGLGGDVPDYSSIVDKDGNKFDVSNWGNLNSWYIGQMAFGTPERSIVVGGHRVDPNILKVGIHAYNTSNRVFIWDFATIPPEDTYLKNYLGRRLWDYYIDTNGVIVPINSKSSIGVQIFNAESTIHMERHGTIVFDGTTINKSVQFDNPLPDEVGTNYTISLSPNDNIQCWWDNKSTSGFTLFVETSTWVGSVDYTISAKLLVTEKDILDLDGSDAYIFNK